MAGRRHHRRAWLRPALVLAGGLAASAFGQVGVRLEADQEKYVRYEPIKVRVTIRNYSGNTLVFSDAPGNRGHLEFQLDAQSDKPVRQTDPEANPVADLILGAGETRQLTLALNSIYDLQRDDVYTIRAQVGHDRLSHDFRSNPITVEVKEGLIVWTRSIGVPSQGAVGAKIESRRVTLLLFHEKRGAISCLRIEDGDMVYGVVRLGMRVSGSDPECDVDGVSNVHVLLQIQSRLYAYRIYDYNARLKQDRYYIAEKSVPHLTRDPDVGRIMVTGGRRAAEGIDFQRVNGQVLRTDRGVRRAPTGEDGAPPDAAAGGGTSRERPSMVRRFLGLFRRAD